MPSDLWHNIHTWVALSLDLFVPEQEGSVCSMLAQPPHAVGQSHMTSPDSRDEQTTFPLAGKKSQSQVSKDTQQS